MGTLYDLLGALPNDDAEGLRVAFRRAAKATHPDTNPGDPDAALRFRQLVRAHNILSDAEQRAAYDQLLAIATRPPVPSRSTVIYEKVHRGATNTMAATLIAAALIGGYAMFSHVSKTSAISEGLASAAERAPVEMAAAAPQQQATVLDASQDKRESVVFVKEPDPTGAIAAAANAINPPLAAIALPALASAPAPAAPDARTSRERGMLAYRGGDLSAALAHYNVAIAQDPGFAAAYADRGIVFYRLRNFERAFADMAHAKRLAKGDKGKSKPAAAAADKPPAPIRVSDRAVPRWRMTAAVTP
jgi:tetratricopeptide (TPR) repeat protein